MQPLDAEGKPAADGLIGLISIGMSNTAMEYAAFKELADADAAKNPRVRIANCAWPGVDTTRMKNPKDGTHPSKSGCEKVGNLLLQFFKTEETAKGWFVK